MWRMGNTREANGYESNESKERMEMTLMKRDESNREEECRMRRGKKGEKEEMNCGIKCDWTEKKTK